jgi:branched-chain amino acid transport system ATP-binding protein
LNLNKDQLRVEELTLSFGGVRALKGVSFSVKEAEIYSVIGPNGAGKTTLFNCICGIQSPDSGRIFFEGREITGLKPHKIASLGIARTFQNIELFSHMTTLQNLMLGRHMHMRGGLLSGVIFYSSSRKEEVENRYEVEKIIEFLELQPYREMIVSYLPYGIQKIIELGRALASESKLLALDEPTAGMNHEEKEELKHRLKIVRDKMGKTILLVEHDMDIVMGLSDRVCVLNYGEKLAEDTPEKVKSHPDVLKAYLGD